MAFFLTLHIFLCVLQVSARSHISSRSPATDPFYKPPAGFENSPPGTILRNRSIDASFLGLVPDPVEAYQLLFRTTAINGSAIATVTTVFKPFNAKTDRFVSFQTAYDSSNTKCDPSYTYQMAAPQTNLITSTEMLNLQAYLLSGYIVASSDYEGPDAAFSAGRLEGMGVLDNMRAVANFKDTLGLSTDEPLIVGVGYSGGATATGWAASLQRTYAPELNVKGWVSGGTPANLTGTLVFLDGQLFSGFLPDALAGLMKPSAYSAQLGPLINRILTPYGRSQLVAAASRCALGDLLGFAKQSVLSTKFQSLGYGILQNPTFMSIFMENTMGINENESPVAPVYLYHAAQDEIIPYANASTLANNWCSDGVSVQFTTFASGGHATTEVLGLPSAIKFTAAAFARAIPKGCSRNTVLSNTLNPLALGANLEPILVKLLDELPSLGLVGNLAAYM